MKKIDKLNNNPQQKSDNAQQNYPLITLQELHVFKQAVMVASNNISLVYRR